MDFNLAAATISKQLIFTKRNCLILSYWFVVSCPSAIGQNATFCPLIGQNVGRTNKYLGSVTVWYVEPS